MLHVGIGLLLALAVNLDFTRRLQPERLGQWWWGVLLDIFNLHLTVHGAQIKGARLTVANHVSWLDIPLIGASELTRFVSKSDVQHWPIAGWLANAGGTFYIRRGKGGARPLLDRLIPHLANGGSVVVFPEGTTTDGTQVLDFHARLFAAATESGAPVQTIAIRYSLDEQGAAVAPFIGDDDLLSHILRLLRTPRLHAEICYGAPLRGTDRDALALAAQEQVRRVLALPARAPESELAPLAA